MQITRNMLPYLSISKPSCAQPAFEIVKIFNFHSFAGGEEVLASELFYRTLLFLQTENSFRHTRDEEYAPSHLLTQVFQL